jgi:protein-disulfide isomerase
MRSSGAAGLLLLLGAAPLWAQQPDDYAARTLGRADAPVTVFELADFQCPACRQFVLTTFPAIKEEYVRTGRVRWVFVNFPLTTLHHNAIAAAEVAMCAARQRRFWDVHDALYQRQPAWANLPAPGPYLLAVADTLGLNHVGLAACVSAGATRARIEQEAAEAGRIGARATPTFLIDHGFLEGAPSPADFRHILDSIYLAKTTPAATAPLRPPRPPRPPHAPR